MVVTDFGNLLIVNCYALFVDLFVEKRHSKTLGAVFVWLIKKKTDYNRIYEYILAIRISF